MHLIFTLLLLILLPAAVVLLLIMRVAGRFFHATRPDDEGRATQRRGWSFTRRKETKKIFGKDEGEYVDFEEIKDGEQ